VSLLDGKHFRELARAEGFAATRILVRAELVEALAAVAGNETRGGR
jgi:hypothetical protein